MKIKLVTAIYNNLQGTELGGRNRATHYNYSLLSLLKMTFADFICYTSEKDIEGLKDFFYKRHNVNPNKLEFRVYELEQITKKYSLNEYKNIEEVKQSERCYELQYAKFEWLEAEAKFSQPIISDSTKHYIFWIDAGLSHTGLLPNKHLDASKLSSQEWPTARYYESPLFNNTFLHNVIEVSHPFFYIEKDNNKEFYVQELADEWYCKRPKTELHLKTGHITIGGLFGGREKAVEDMCYNVKHLLDHYISREGVLPTEEQVMTVAIGCTFFPDYLKPQRFDTWWHEDSNIQDVHPIEYFKENKSFYKVLEGLQ